MVKAVVAPVCDFVGDPAFSVGQGAELEVVQVPELGGSELRPRRGGASRELAPTLAPFEKIGNRANVGTPAT